MPHHIQKPTCPWKITGFRDPVHDQQSGSHSVGSGSDQAFPAPVHTRTSIITFSNAKAFLNAFLHYFLTRIIAISIVNKALLIALGETGQAFTTAYLIVLNYWVYKKS